MQKNYFKIQNQYEIQNLICFFSHFQGKIIPHLNSSYQMQLFETKSIVLMLEIVETKFSLSRLGSDKPISLLSLKKGLKMI